MNRSAEKVEKFEKLGTKKPYEAPKLLVYGNLAEMTRTLGRHGKRDHPVGQHHTFNFTGA
jgi:hypothetical protein